MKLSFGLIAIALAAGLTTGSLAFADNFEKPGAEIQNEIPAELKEATITEHLGEKIDLDMKFKDETGALVPLRTYVADGKPMLLSMAYYSCPSLCNFHLNGLTDAFVKMKEPLGEVFHHVVVSIEPKETPDLAKIKKDNYMKAYGRPEGAQGWHWMTGEQANITALSKQVGFGYRWDEEAKQYAHASAAMVIAPDGKITRYLYGIVFDPKTVRLSMVEAAHGEVGTTMDRLILYCFHFDPKSSKYSLKLFNIMRGGGVLIILAMIGFIAPFWIRNSRKASQGES
ncbi:MAG: SCO family protein [Proteobacteria bacterium]|nr:MAG: SCO family protein [Pseudomonadota bacterium]